MIDRQIFEVWGSKENDMNKKNEKTRRVGWVLVLAALLAVPYGAWMGLYRPRGHRVQVFGLRVAMSIPTVVLGLLVYFFGRTQDVLMLEVGSQIPILTGLLMILTSWESTKSLWFPAKMVPDV